MFCDNTCSYLNSKRINDTVSIGKVKIKEINVLDKFSRSYKMTIMCSLFKSEEAVNEFTNAQIHKQNKCNWLDKY